MHHLEGSSLRSWMALRLHRRHSGAFTMMPSVSQGSDPDRISPQAQSALYCVCTADLHTWPEEELSEGDAGAGCSFCLATLHTYSFRKRYCCTFWILHVPFGCAPLRSACASWCPEDQNGGSLVLAHTFRSMLLSGAALLRLFCRLMCFKGVCKSVPWHLNQKGTHAKSSSAPRRPLP